MKLGILRLDLIYRNIETVGYWRFFTCIRRSIRHASQDWPR